MIIRFFPIIAFALLSALPAQAQTIFQKTIGGADGEQFWHTEETDDGGFIFAGTWATLTDDRRSYLVKTNAAGDTMWTRSFDQPRSLYSARRTADRGYVLFGIGPDAYVIKLDGNGDPLWSRYFEPNTTNWTMHVVQADDGGYVLAHNTLITDFGALNIVLVKTNASGEHVWTRQYGGADCQLNMIKRTADGGYILCGQYKYFGLGSDLYLLKLNSAGATAWAKVYGGIPSEAARDVVQTSDGGYIATGFSNWTNGEKDTYVVRTNAIGDTLWTRNYNGFDTDEGYSIRETPDGDFVIAGEALTTTSLGSGGSYDAYMLKIDGNGDLIWSRTYGGVESDAGNCAIPTTDGGIMLAGRTWSSGAGNFDAYMIKTDAAGHTDCNEYEGNFTMAMPPTMIATIVPTNVSLTTVLEDFDVTIGGGGAVGSPCGNAGVEQLEHHSYFSLQPNPSAGVFVIVSDQANTAAVVDVFNAIGERVSTHNFAPGLQRTVDLGDVAAGMYSVMMSAGGEKHCEKLVIARDRCSVCSVGNG